MASDSDDYDALCEFLTFNSGFNPCTSSIDESRNLIGDDTDNAINSHKEKQEALKLALPLIPQRRQCDARICNDDDEIILVEERKGQTDGIAERCTLTKQLRHKEQQRKSSANKSLKREINSDFFIQIPPVLAYCKICNARYFNVNSVKKHIRMVHNIDDNEHLITKTHSKCPFNACIFETNSTSYMICHLKRVHLTAAKAKCKNKQNYPTAVNGNESCDADEIIVLDENTPTSRIFETSILMQQHQQLAQGQEQQSDGIDDENLTIMSNLSFPNQFNNVFHFTNDGDRDSQIQTMDTTIGDDDDMTQNLAELLANSSGDTQPFSLNKISQSQTLNGQEIQAEATEDCCRQERPILRAKLIAPPAFSAQLSSFSPNDTIHSLKHNEI